jgi:hypothetical protein
VEVPCLAESATAKTLFEVEVEKKKIGSFGTQAKN